MKKKLLIFASHCIQITSKFNLKPQMQFFWYFAHNATNFDFFLSEITQ